MSIRFDLKFLATKITADHSLFRFFFYTKKNNNGGKVQCPMNTIALTSTSTRFIRRCFFDVLVYILFQKKNSNKKRFSQLFFLNQQKHESMCISVSTNADCSQYQNQCVMFSHVFRYTTKF